MTTDHHQKERGVFTRAEILSQPDAWKSALEVLDANKQALMDLYAQGNYDQVVFTGCGSTYYLSLAAAALYQDLSGKAGRAFPASELWLYPQSAYTGAGRVLLVAVSRSGATTETLRACAAFLAGGRGDLLTISCYADQPLASMGRWNLVFPSGAEESMAQTRAFSTLYLACIAFAALWSGRQDLYASLAQLSAPAARIMAEHYNELAAIGRNLAIDRFYFLGSGIRYGLACELSLKMKEMTLSHSEPFHFMEFRHGPKSMITSGALVVGLLSGSNAGYENAVLEEMRAMGAQVLKLGENAADISFESGLDEAVRSVLALPAGQILGYERSMGKGLDPDRPQNLDAVVRL